MSSRPIYVLVKIRPAEERQLDYYSCGLFTVKSSTAGGKVARVEGVGIHVITI